MAATVEKARTEACSSFASLGQRMDDAKRRAARLAEEARGLKTAAEDAIAGGIETVDDAVRSARDRVRALGDLPREARARVEHMSEDLGDRIKRSPCQALGSALGAGIVLGAALGWLATRGRRPS